MGALSAQHSAAPSTREARWHHTGARSISDPGVWRNARNMPATGQANVRDPVRTSGMLLAVHTWSVANLSHGGGECSVSVNSALDTVTSTMRKEPERGDTSSAALPVLGCAEHSDWVLCRAHGVWDLLL